MDWAGLSVTEGGVLTPVSSGPWGAVTGEGAVSVGTAATREARSCTERERSTIQSLQYYWTVVQIEPDKATMRER